MRQSTWWNGNAACAARGRRDSPAQTAAERGHARVCILRAAAEIRRLAEWLDCPAFGENDLRALLYQARGVRLKAASVSDVDDELAPLFDEAALSLGMPRRLLARVLSNARSDEELDARAAIVAEVIALAAENEVALSDEARERLSEIESDDTDDEAAWHSNGKQRTKENDNAKRSH
jgi:hypothetical protein